MKRIMLIAIGSISLCAGSVFSSSGFINLHSDPVGIRCYISDTTPGYFKVYVFHEWTTGATASRFKLVSSAGFTATYIGETIYWFFNSLGNTQEGIVIAYGICLVGQFLIATITYYGYGTSEPCSYLEVVPHPDAETGKIEMVDCTMPIPLLHEIWSQGGVVINWPGDPCYRWCVLPIEDTSWGRIKALYQQ